tara:strand:+ start:177 stop:896 length:720 start_codon:yes stop_codon:yes gene_type:complete
MINIQVVNNLLREYVNEYFIILLSFIIIIIHISLSLSLSLSLLQKGMIIMINEKHMSFIENLISGEQKDISHTMINGDNNMTWKDRKNEFMNNEELDNAGEVATKISKELQKLNNSSKSWSGKKEVQKSSLEEVSSGAEQVVKQQERMPSFGLETSAEKIKIVFAEVQEMLLQKNEQYGDSALSPNRIFSKASTDEQLKVRIDDKLNRLIMGNDSMESDDDVIKDLIGYFVLLLVSQRG